MFYYIFNSKVTGKYIAEYEEYIVLFRLFIYVLYSFTHTFAAVYIGVLFTHPMAAVLGESFI